MATYRLIHVVRDGNGDTTGLAEYTNSDTVLLPVHSSDPSGSAEGEMIYRDDLDTIKLYTGSAWVQVGNSTEAIQDITGAQIATNGSHTGITATYQDSDGDGAIDLALAATINVNTIAESTTDNGIAVDTFKLKDGLMVNSATIAGTQTIASTDNAMIIGPASITGTINVSGNLSIL